MLWIKEYYLHLLLFFLEISILVTLFNQTFCHIYISEEQLRVICLDLLIAGSQTTSNVIEFALLTVLRNQRLQEKIYDEIHGTIGDEVPCWSDSYRWLFFKLYILSYVCFLLYLSGKSTLIRTNTILVKVNKYGNQFITSPYGPLCDKDFSAS